jgi:hypothetical protein
MIALIEFSVACWYRIFYAIFYEQPIPEGGPNDPPIVFIPGLLGFQPTTAFGIRYFDFDSKRCRRKLFFPPMPPFGDNTVRAECVRKFLQGGVVKVRGETLCEYAIGAYPQWSPDYPVEMISHSQGTLVGDILVASDDIRIRTHIRLNGIAHKPE